MITNEDRESASENADEDESNSSVIMREPEFEFISQELVDDLNHRQQIEYAVHRRDFISWMRDRGKNPKKGKPLSETCVENYAWRHNQICRWVWSQTGHYTGQLTQDQADMVVEALNDDLIVRDDGDQYSATSKRKFQNLLKKWFEYRHDKYDAEDWTPPVEFDDNVPEDDADPFLKAERTMMYNASLEYKSPPPYDNLSPEERSRWKAHLAQVLGKSKDKVRPSDFETLRTSWKYPSLIGAALDGALRPIEINRSQIDWLSLSKGEIHIPKEFAAKNRENWKITLRERTVHALRRWKKQRENKEKYDDSNAIWLNKQANPYNSKNLNYLLDQLLEIAEIEPENRKIVWYSFRKSTATYAQSESDAITTANMIRSTPENVQNYAEPTPEEKRNILENIDE